MHVSKSCRSYCLKRSKSCSATVRKPSSLQLSPAYCAMQLLQKQHGFSAAEPLAAMAARCESRSDMKIFNFTDTMRRCNPIAKGTPSALSDHWRRHAAVAPDTPPLHFCSWSCVIAATGSHARLEVHRLSKKQVSPHLVFEASLRVLRNSLFACFF